MSEVTDEGNGKKLGTASTGVRGWPRVQFRDAYDHSCEVSCSSAIGDYEDSMSRPGTSFLWLGIEDPNPQVMASEAEQFGIETDEEVGWVEYPIPAGVSIWTRMHINREQAEGLIGRLQEWLETGKFDDSIS